MPVLKISMLAGRSPSDLRLLLDTTHEIVLLAFNVPERDRYQIVTEHDDRHLIALDTGLGIARSQDFVMIEIVSRPRLQAEKLNFYRLLAQSLHLKCGVLPSDLMVYFVENADVDWSFGMGSAQFMTGEL